MKTLSLLVLLTAAAAVPVFAQIESSTAPVVWERYNIADQKLSFSFPKMPVLIADSPYCSEVDRRSYYAYAEGTVYEVTIVAKRKQFVVSGCRTVELFTPELIKARLNELRFSNGVEALPTIDEKASQKVYTYSRELTHQKLYDDASNSRWVEMIAHYWNNDKGDSHNFFDSVQFASTEGKDIGEGAAQTRGDPQIKQPPAAKIDPIKPAVTSGQDSGSGSGGGIGSGKGNGNGNGSVSPPPVTTVVAVTTPLTIIAKPRARYTNEARDANLQGTVVLKVTLLASGGVGSIVVVKPLEYGLTEQAIAAAKRVVFLPKRINGYAVSVSKTIEYGFSIY